MQPNDPTNPEQRRYHMLEPEVAGQLGPGTVLDTTVHPPRVSVLHYEFSDWLGDDLLQTFPCYLASTSLATAIEGSALTGYRLAHVQVTLSAEAVELLGDKQVPEFRWLIPAGAAGRDDFGTTDNGTIVVSERALTVLRRFMIDNCDIIAYAQAT